MDLIVMIELRIFEITLSYLDRSTRYFVSVLKKTEAGKYRVRKDVMMEAEISVISLLEGDHEQRNAGCL